jgi:arylsulfatase A-like enzyme
VWQQKWFDYNEFKPENDNDVALARRFVEMYRERDKNKPLFFHWMSRSMHIPFDLPADMGERPADAEAAYLRAEAYMDSALGIIVNEVKNGPRANSTLFILVGDHSYPNSAQTAESERLGKIHEGETWVSLIFAGAGAERTMDLRPVSQGSIASSIVAFLGLDVSNHFMGATLLNKAVEDSLQPRDSVNTVELPGVYSFRQGEIAYRIDSLAFFAGMDDATPATVRTASWKADWDVSRPVEGFVSGRSVTVDEKLLAETTAKMRAAAHAWEFVVTKNKLMP